MNPNKSIELAGITGKPKVAFVCVHNSCRSQLAEALARALASDVYEAYSAGTELRPHINPDAVRMLKHTHGIDMEVSDQRPKLLTDIPAVDIVITMGCNVDCPFVPCQYREDWGLEDPTGQDDEVFIATIKRIEELVLGLAERLAS